MFIELHLIQNFSPANLNRDDTNNPKDCEFGGHRRARISSQAMKRAIRHEPVFAETTKAALGERSKWMTRPIKQKLVEEHHKDEVQAASVAAAFVSAYASQMDKKSPQKTSVLVYFSQEEIDTVVDGLINNWDEAVKTSTKGTTLLDLVKTLEKETTDRTSAPDIALFGRMLAEKPTLNIDAACQVAHAISTHRVNMEMDFYTAVDTLQDSADEEGAGAGMMGFTNFNSACFYRYARIDFQQLLYNLGWRNPEKTRGNRDEIAESNRSALDLARRTVEGFLRAAVDAIPTGKQNSFAAQNPTSLALATVRTDGKSWNLANAFEEPVRARRDSGLIRPSIESLDNYWGELTQRRDDAKFDAIAVFADSAKHAQALNTLSSAYQPTLSTWVKTIVQALPEE
jgi:CRISPR system Cascade subunit CasC